MWLPPPQTPPPQNAIRYKFSKSGPDPSSLPDPPLNWLTKKKTHK